MRLLAFAAIAALAFVGFADNASAKDRGHRHKDRHHHGERHHGHHGHKSKHHHHGKHHHFGRPPMYMYEPLYDPYFEPGVTVCPKKSGVCITVPFR